MKKRDLLFAAIAVLIVVVLWAAPPETTIKVPFDDTHRELKGVLEREGKKAAEAVCRTCHNEQDLPLSKDHPPKYRCLFCHKFSDPRPQSSAADTKREPTEPGAGKR